MEPIKIHLSVELNLSQDVKEFISSVVNVKSASTASSPAPVNAPERVTTPAAKVTPTPAAPAAPASAAPATPTSAPTIEQVRQALAAKVNGHREEIKAKLNSLGAPSVTKLDPAKYSEMFTFLTSLS